MARSFFQLTPGGLARAMTMGVAGLFGALLASSCLTPDIEFVESSDNDDGDDLAPHCTDRKKNSDETDVDCGGLDCQKCALGRECRAHADCLNESCTQGQCQDPDCTDGVKNGTSTRSETDIDCGGDKCPKCVAEKRCLSDEDCEEKNCAGGTCAEASCNDKVTNGEESDRDCGGTCDGCPIGKTCVTRGDCAQPPGDDPSATLCVGDVCELSCDPGFHDCNNNAEDGCETNLNTDLDHCGKCNSLCDLPNTTSSKCADGQCLIDFEDDGGCTGAFLDINGDPDLLDGCEVDSDTNVEHCGAANQVCSAQNGVPDCRKGECNIACESQFADCDNEARGNGCEVNISLSTLHCGACDNTCEPGAATESPFCDFAASPVQCGSIDCSPPNECDDGELCGACGADGECNDTLNTSANCGRCGEICGAENAKTECRGAPTEKSCAISECVDTDEKDFEDCDKDYSNGCEAEVLADVSNCGGCAADGAGLDCGALMNDDNLNITGIQCTKGECKITGCKEPWLDCDGQPANGCEVDVNANNQHCNGCNADAANSGEGVDCTEFVGGNDISGVECTNQSCQVSGCSSAHLRDCNRDVSDGCETNTDADLTRCGGCLPEDGVDGDAGGETCAAKDHANESCVTGTGCQWICDMGWIDANTDLQTPGSDGCELPVAILVNSSTNGLKPRSAMELTLTHELETSAGNLRMVLVGVASQQLEVISEDSVAESVVYGGQPMAKVQDAHVDGTNSSSSLWVLYEGNLPDEAGPQSVVVTATSADPTPWGGTYAEVLEFKHVKQYPTPDDVPTDMIENNSSCNWTTPPELIMRNSVPGSILYGIAGAQAPTSGPSNDRCEPRAGFTTELTDHTTTEPNPYLQVSSAYSTPLMSGGDILVSLAQEDCWSTQLSTIEIEAGD